MFDVCVSVLGRCVMNLITSLTSTGASLLMPLVEGEWNQCVCVCGCVRVCVSVCHRGVQSMVLKITNDIRS